MFMCAISKPSPVVVGLWQPVFSTLINLVWFVGDIPYSQLYPIEYPHDITMKSHEQSTHDIQNH